MTEPAERRLAAILSADVAGYSRLMADDEDATVRALRATREQVASLIAEHRGQLADFTGDNFLAEFAAARDAVECALAIQRVVEARNAALPEPRRMRFRIGAHLGDVRHEDGRLFGDGVNIAARLQPLAEPGGLCISSTVADLVRGKLAIALDDMGQHTLKNIPERVRAYRVRSVSEAAPPAAKRRPRWLAPAIGPAAIAVIAGLTLVARDRAPTLEPESVTTSELAPIRSIAVLPLANLSGDPEQEYFADGMTETLIAELAKLPGVRVISRTSVIQFKGTKTALPEIAKTLNVDGVIEGSVMRAESQVRITAQLVDARADRHLWAEQYDRELARVLEIQSEVARAVAAQIQLALTPEQSVRLKAPKNVDPRAQDAYLRGLAHRRWDTAALKNSIAAFEEAIRIDAHYAPAYAALANSRHYLTLTWGAEPRDQLPQAKREALEAVALDESLGDAHAALGGILFRYDWKLEDAEKAYDRGLALGVNDPINRVMYASLLFAQARSAEAWQWLDSEVESAPLDRVIRNHRASLLSNGGEYERALLDVDWVLEVDPNDAWALGVRALCLEQLGRFDDAISTYRRMADVGALDSTEVQDYERAWQASGRDGYWRLFQARETNPFLRALASIEAGSYGEALAALEQAAEVRDTRMVFLWSFARLAPLRSDPRFAELARRMNFPKPRTTP